MWFRFDINGMNGGTFQDVNGCGAMILFLTMLCNPYCFKIKLLIKWITITMASGAIYAIIFWRNFIDISSYTDIDKTTAMAMACVYSLMSGCFLLLLTNIIPRNVKIYTLAFTFLCLIVAMMAGRRGYSGVIILFLLEYFVLYILYGKKKRKIFRILMTVLIIIGCYYYYWTYKDTQFLVFTNRLDTDSRSDVFYWWNKEMAKSNLYWWLGKGVSGGYWDGGFGCWRPGIENGVAQMILKGGLLYLCSYVLLSFQAIYLGFFKSNNRVMKGSALYILTLTLFLLVWGTPSITITHLCLWISYTWIFNNKLNDYPQLSD